MFENRLLKVFTFLFRKIVHTHGLSTMSNTPDQNAADLLKVQAQLLQKIQEFEAGKRKLEQILSNEKKQRLIAEQRAKEAEMRANNEKMRADNEKKKNSSLTLLSNFGFSGSRSKSPLNEYPRSSVRPSNVTLENCYSFSISVSVSHSAVALSCQRMLGRKLSDHNLRSLESVLGRLPIIGELPNGGNEVVKSYASQFYKIEAESNKEADYRKPIEKVLSELVEKFGFKMVTIAKNCCDMAIKANGASDSDKNYSVLELKSNLTKDPLTNLTGENGLLQV